MAATGLFISAMDVDKFIRINNLQEVTNPIYLDKNTPTVDGVLSYEIFGISQEERKGRMAYIDLHGHYMHPLAAKKIAAYDRTLAKVLYGQGRWKLVDGALVDDENGESGPEYLYSIWGKVKVKDKETLVTKEVQEYYEQDRNKLFITKLPVIPAFYRDINVSTSSASKSTSIINSMYSSIISYTQTLQMYTDTFSGMGYITRGRVQTIISDIYDEFIINTVKGQPSKFGMIRRSMLGKNLNYSARLVISSPVLRKDSYRDVQVRYGYAVVPLAYTLSCFFPFMVHHLKAFFDSEFLQGGKYQVVNRSGETEYVTITESFDENEITKMIMRYINSPSSRFDKVPTPPDQNGTRYHMTITGRFGTENTTITRPATLTDIMYIVAHRVTQDKHVIVTRYPLDNYNGQWPGRVEVATTVHTQPAIIGETVYEFFPVCEGDPSNVFIDTMQFSNTYLMKMGGDWTHSVMVPAAVMS